MNEITKDISNLEKEVDVCKSTVPALVIDIVARLKDDFYENKLTREIYTDYATKVVNLAGIFEGHCKCSESRK